MLRKDAHAGYLTDLTPYADKYDWWSRLPKWAIERNTYKGKLYAYPWEQDLEYVYYNKNAFKELGIEVPKNFEEVLAWCDKASAAGKKRSPLARNTTSVRAGRRPQR